MLSGKFSARTDGAHPPEAVIDEALAAKYFPKGDAIGGRIRVGGEKNPWLTDYGNRRHCAAHDGVQRNAMGGAADGIALGGGGASAERLDRCSLTR